MFNMYFYVCKFVNDIYESSGRDNLVYMQAILIMFVKLMMWTKLLKRHTML